MANRLHEMACSTCQKHTSGSHAPSDSKVSPFLQGDGPVGLPGAIVAGLQPQSSTTLKFARLTTSRRIDFLRDLADFTASSACTAFQNPSPKATSAAFARLLTASGGLGSDLSWRKFRLVSHGPRFPDAETANRPDCYQTPARGPQTRVPF